MPSERAQRRTTDDMSTQFAGLEHLHAHIFAEQGREGVSMAVDVQKVGHDL